MPLLPDDRLDSVLRSQNSWWASGVLPARVRHSQARRIDHGLAESDKPSLVLGPRRSGKTAALLRLLDRHLRSGGSPKEVAYVPLDHPVLRLAPLGPLVDRVVKLLDPSPRPVLLLDGLQSVPEWPERFQELLATRPQPRFVATSAVAPGFEDPSLDVFALPPLTFREFCGLRGLPDLGAPPLDLLSPRLPDGDAAAADDYLYDRVLDPVLADYLVRGGFPEAVLDSDVGAGQAAVREEVVARAIYQDVPAVVGVLKIADLERTLLAALLHGTGPLPMEAFAESLDLDRQTVGRYLDHLERAFLLTPLRNFAATTERSRPRLFPVDPSLPNALLERGVGVLARPAERQDLLAGAVVAHVNQYAAHNGYDLTYFRDGDLEADLVLVSPQATVPILLTDTEEIGEDDLARVEKVLKKTQASTAFLLSRARPRRKTAVSFFEAVYHMPAAYFLHALRL